jgi:hypothetical protein
MNEDQIKNFAIAAMPGGIEAQEACGQREFVNSTTLPRKYNSGLMSELGEFGVKFGEAVDDLFQYVELPQGWRKEATDHSMWSKLYDDKGRERATIFYKASFYDLDAFVNVSRRYSYSPYESCDELGNDAKYGDDNATHIKTVITDCGQPIHLVAIRKADEGYEATDRHCEAAQLWLDEHYPQWRFNTAYWRDEQ